MIEYYNGTVFNANADVIVNTVNTVGAMGNGLALEFKLRYPKLEEEYLNDLNNDKLLIGLPRMHNINNQLILNFPTKQHWKAPSKLNYIEASLKYINRNYTFLKQRYNINSIAFPKLGSGLGGLDWNLVNNLMEQYLNNIDLHVYICLDEITYAEGIEKKMLDIINTQTDKNLKNNFNLTINQHINILNSLPLKRFWHLSKVKSIGKKTYESIYKSIYSIALNKKNFIEQVSIFDSNDNKITKFEKMTKLELINIILKYENKIYELNKTINNKNNDSKILLKDNITSKQISKTKKFLTENMTQKEISKKVNLSKTSISRIKNGYYDK